jgi:hypothetical protein
MSADNKAVNLSAVLKSHAAYIRGEGGERADLSGANLRWANLSGADLTDAILIDAILIDAILIDAILTDANLSGADLTGANLRLADAPAETAVADAWQRHWDDRAAAEIADLKQHLEHERSMRLRSDATMIAAEERAAKAEAEGEEKQ